MRNHSVDYLKTFLIFGVIYLHVGTFITFIGDYHGVTLYLYALFSIVNPLFFIISGYYIAISRNIEKRIKSLFLSYSFMYSITLYFNITMYGAKDSFIDVIRNYLLFYPSTIGYLWFIKFLLYFYSIVFLFMGKNNRMKLIVIILYTLNLIYYLKFFDYSQYILGEYYLQVIPFAIGVVIAKTHPRFKNKIVILLSLFLFLALPFMNNMKYEQFDFKLIFVCTIIFISALSFQAKSCFTSFISNNTIYILFLHYFVVELFSIYIVSTYPWIKTMNYSYFVIYIIIITFALILNYCYQQLIREFF